MEQPKTFHLPITRGQTFTGTSVTLDNIHFENCVFKNCDIIYSGGAAETSACYFETCGGSSRDRLALSFM